MTLRATGGVLVDVALEVEPPNNPPRGTPQANLFYPLASIGAQWNTSSPPPDMFQGRWYPTGTTLPDGNVLTSSGLDENRGVSQISIRICLGKSALTR